MANFSSRAVGAPAERGGSRSQGAPFTSYGTALEAIKSHPRNQAVALQAVAFSESLFRDLPKGLREDVGFVTKAALANPALLKPEWQEANGRTLNAQALPTKVRTKVLQDPKVKEALRAAEAERASTPDLDPANFDFNRPLLASLRANRAKAGASDPRPRAVVIYPMADEAGQFQPMDLPETLSKAYQVMFYRVATDDDFAKAVKEATAGKQAKLLVIGGHGEKTLAAFGAEDPAGLSEDDREAVGSGQLSEAQAARISARIARLHEENYLDFTDADLIKPLNDHLEEESDVVLVSCSTGSGGPQGRNLARFLAANLPKANVHAPTRPVPNLGIDVDRRGLFAQPGYARLPDGAIRIDRGSANGWRPR